MKKMNFNENDTFFIDTEEESVLCRVITTMYQEKRKKYYVIYEYVDSNEEVYVSSYDPNGEDDLLKDIEDEEELKEIISFFEEFSED